jgi:hypothetical protein
MLPGDHFGMRNAALYCQQHYELVIDEPSCGPPSPTLNFFNGAGSCQKGRPRKRNKETVDMIPTTPIGELGSTEPYFHSIDLDLDMWFWFCFQYLVKILRHVSLSCPVYQVLYQTLKGSYCGERS